MEGSQQGPWFSGMLHNVDQKHVFHSLEMHFSIFHFGLKFTKKTKIVWLNMFFSCSKFSNKVFENILRIIFSKFESV